MTSQASQSPPVLPRLDGLRILCVDDDPDTIGLYVYVLGQCGAEVTGAASLTEGLEMFEKVRPAVMVADIGMSDGDGYTLVKAIRSRSRAGGGDVPAVAVTGYAGHADAARALQDGYDIHLAKPIDPARLCEVVSQLARLGRVLNAGESESR